MFEIWCIGGVKGLVVIELFEVFTMIEWIFFFFLAAQFFCIYIFFMGLYYLSVCIVKEINVDCRL